MKEKWVEKVTNSEIYAIAVSDIHLSDKPPLFRSSDSWYERMEDYLAQLNSLSIKHRCPILCAGDVLNHWKEPPRLVNFALKHLPVMYAIPGQHDLPNHQIKDIQSSAYWTLVQAGVIRHLNPGSPWPVGPLVLYGWPWGSEVKPPFKEPHDISLHIALVHQYVWIKERSYQGAPEEQRLKHFKKKVEGYDAVIVGDNHKGFLVGNILNSGGFMIRKSDEINYKPGVGIIHSDGKITRHYLDISRDKYLSQKDIVTKAENTPNFGDFLGSLSYLEDHALDFKEAIKQEMNNRSTKEEVRKIVTKVIDNEKD